MYSSDDQPTQPKPAPEREDPLIAAARRDYEHRGPASPDDVLIEAPSPVAVGTIAADSFPGYEIVREIHRGGQGVVYQAIQKTTRRKVAIKVMKEGPFVGPRDKVRFEREVQILGQLDHPHIVRIHDSGSSTGSDFFVMDYISGQALDAYVAQKKLSIDDTLRLFEKIAAAVSAAHLRGVIHRDLKPSNIRIDVDSEPHILDFGLARTVMGEATDGEHPQVMTITGEFIGSLPWASPEQAEGSPGKIDLRTDVYSLGVILYQMLTGRFPYEVVGNMREVLDRIMHAEPARPSSIGWHGKEGRHGKQGWHGRPARERINDEVETIVLKCLAKERDRRYESAGALVKDIRRYLAGEPIEAKRDSALYVLKKRFKRHRLAFVVAVASLTAIAASGVAFLSYSEKEQIATEASARKKAASEHISSLTAAKAAEAKLRQASDLVRARKDLPAARTILNETIENAPSLTDAYVWRGMLSSIRAMQSRLEERDVLVDEALSDFHRGFLAAGGERLFDELPKDWSGPVGGGSGSLTAYVLAQEVLDLTGRNDQRNKLVARAESLGLLTPETLATLDTTDVPPIYDINFDPLVVAAPSQSPEEARMNPDTDAEIRIVLPIREIVVHDLRRASSYERFITDLMYDGRMPFDEGPYRLHGEPTAGRVELVRRENYNDPSPHCAKITFLTVPDASEQLRMLAAGEVDAIPLSGPDFMWHVNGSSFAGHVRKLKGPYIQYDYIVWNTQGPLFSDPRVRCAMTRALDLDGIRASKYGDLYKPFDGIFHHLPWMQDATRTRMHRLAFDASAACSLLDESGWRPDPARDGIRMKDGRPFECRLLAAREAPILGTLVDLQRALRAVGAYADIDLIPLRECVNRLGSREFDAYVGSVIPNREPEKDPVRWCTGGSRNYGGYSNPKVDALFKQASQIDDPIQQADIYAEIERLIYEDQPYTFLWKKPSMWAIHRRVRGIDPAAFSPTGSIPSPRDWWVAKE